jgi:diguanylate cyclase (GGDEF)-like protein
MSAEETVFNDITKPQEVPASTQGGRPVLIIFEKEHLLEWRLLTGKRTRLGRDNDADIVLRDDTASRSHAVVCYENIDNSCEDPVCTVNDLQSRNGTLHNNQPVSAPVQLRSGDRIVIGVFTLIYQVRTAQEIEADMRLRAMATTDPLTGVLNRAALASLASREIDRAGRYQRPLSLVILDLDHFKKINDTYGHVAGDAVLTHLGQALNARKRNHDVAARYGGEEFCLLLPETNLQGAIIVAERLRLAIENLVMPIREDLELRVTASFGAAQYLPSDGTRFDLLVARADAALYRAKHSGRNRVCGPGQEDVQATESIALMGPFPPE